MLYTYYILSCRRDFTMYILFEKIKSDGSNDISNWDCMGTRAKEEEAIEWVLRNPDYRVYKYCMDEL